jgi:hypothetical protein
LAAPTVRPKPLPTLLAGHAPSRDVAAAETKKGPKPFVLNLEREKSLELSTSTLARLRSTN